MQQAEYKTFYVWGLHIRYVEAGEGPVIILVHGLADSLLSWYRNIDALADAGFRVIVPDLPGSGLSDKPDHLEYSSDAAAEFIFDFAHELEISEMSLVGNSAGALISGMFALKHPETVAKIALIAPSGFGKKVPWPVRAISVPVLGNLLYQPWLNQRIGITKRLFHRPPSLLAELLPEMNRLKALPGTRTAVIRSIRSNINLLGVRENAYIQDNLKRSAIPLLTIWGSEDKVIPIEYAENARIALLGSIVKVIQNCGHWPQMEKPDQVNHMLINFLKGPLGPETQQES
jgi:4,5:9,10-diseco-3-hydroxy-5,9,17-trioxoandrosta-1(10),2-diene-4-oate hydrolase